MGDRLEVFNTGISVGLYNLTEDDVARGYIDYSLAGLVDGNFFVSATVTDLAGNVSYVSSLVFEVDITPLVVSSAETAENIDENSGAEQVVYTASVDGTDLWKYQLSEDSDSALSIHPDTGEVTLATNPDYEKQSNYSFTVIAVDNAGNEGEQAVTLTINNLDEVAPAVTSSDTAATIDENSGAGQLIYTATADDSADVSDGFTFSLAEGSDSALSIEASTGAVTLATDPDHETQAQYSFCCDCN